MDHPMGQRDQHSAKDTQGQLAKLLQGAFSGPPTPLKDIPKKSGESRSLKRRSASDATAKTVPPRT
jgi:hypothetical protein